MYNYFMQIKKRSLTKEKIKKVAVELFNDKDTLSITTNHIASKANISPGNLYYHYKNKEDIILKIYLQMSNEFENFESFESILNNDNPIKELSLMFDKYGELFWNYRFLMRDSAVLMALYPRLKEMFIQRQDKRVFQIEGLIRYFLKEGIFENIPQEDIHLRAKLNWFISAYWQIFISTSGKITKESIKEAKEIVFKINILPFLTIKGKKMIDENTFI